MAVGVPEIEVFAAADRVLARGERPTVERVRAELGRGSPARVGQLLETWWEALAQRLAGEIRLPELPAEVAQAFRTIWATAIQHGCQTADAAMVEAATELTREREALAEERARWQIEIATANAARREAEHALEATQARVVDLQRSLEQHITERTDLQQQRDLAVAALEALRSQAERTQLALAEGQAAWSTERRALETAHRADQDRWLTEVDRARQEAARAAARLTQQEKAAAALRNQLQRQVETAQKAQRGAEQEQAAASAKAAVLATQMRLLHKQLAKAMQRGVPTRVAPAPKTVRRRAQPLSSG